MPFFNLSLQWLITRWDQALAQWQTKYHSVRAGAGPGPRECSWVSTWTPGKLRLRASGSGCWRSTAGDPAQRLWRWPVNTESATRPQVDDCIWSPDARPQSVAGILMSVLRHGHGHGHGIFIAYSGYQWLAWHLSWFTVTATALAPLAAGRVSTEIVLNVQKQVTMNRIGETTHKVSKWNDFFFEQGKDLVNCMHYPGPVNMHHAVTCIHACIHVQKLCRCIHTHKNTLIPKNTNISTDNTHRHKYMCMHMNVCLHYHSLHMRQVQTYTKQLELNVYKNKTWMHLILTHMHSDIYIDTAYNTHSHTYIHAMVQVCILYFHARLYRNWCK